MDSIGEEREQIEDDIERLNLALQVEGSTVELNDEEEEELDDIFTNEDSIDPDDYESVNTIPSQDSEPTHVETSEIDQMSGMSEISHLPINAETCLALNRTYQELILESLKKIELALNENREKQKVLEEGLETKSKGAPKTTDKSTTNKKKSSAMFCKPYFKDKDQKVAPHNSDVEMKKMTQEHKQDVSPPQTWSIAQRCKLQEAIKAEGLKQKIVPLLNRKEILVEKVKHIETELMKISIESFKNEENVTDDEEEREHLTGTREIKEQDLVELKQKIEEVDKEMEKAKQTSEIELLFNLDSEKVDWLMIANVIFDGKRDERECRIMWKNVLHPSINKEKWSAQETKDLQELANKYNMRNWPAIAKELGTGRTPFQCLQFYQHSLNETWNNRPWTGEEDEMLREVVESVRMGNRISFAQVSYFLDGRSQSQCTSRWNQINPSMKRGRWSLHEDCLLITAVQLHGPKNWRLIKEYVHGRTPIQCRDRYNNCLNPSINAAQTWTYEDDKLLLKRVNSQLEKGSSVSWVKILPEFPGRIDGQLLSRYRRLQAWKMKSEWVEKQSEQEKKNMGVLEGEQLLREITKEEPTTSFLEMSKSFPDVCKEDYLKQIEDRRRGDLVVPRPPVMTHCATRCVQALWTRKKHLFSLVDQHLKNMDKLVPDHSTNIKEFKMFESLSKIQEKILRETMAKHPSDITVKDMLKISKKLTRTESCKDGRTKWIERDLICDDQIKDILIWKCFHSLLVDKRCGRPRKFYLFSPTGRKPPCAEEDDDEDVEKITDITVTLLMNALDVDHKSALEKSRELDPNSSTVGEEIDLLRRTTNCGSALGRKRKVAVGTDQDAQVQSKKSKAISSSSNENANSSCNGKESSSVVQKNSNGCTEKNLNSVGVVGQGSSTPVANINRTSSSLGENPSSKTNMSALPAGARIIRLPPGVKLKPGDKIQDILAAHKLSMAALESQSSTASPVPEPGSRKKKKKSKSQPQKQSVVVLRPPSGIQDPKRVKILPPGTITTCAFKSVMLHRKYLMIRADELYSRQFYRLRGNELQKRVTLELSKQATGAVKIERNENEQHVGALNKTLYTMEKSVASSVAAKTARIKQKGEVGHDALAKVRKTKEFKMLQKRFEALFAWPALLSTISPPFISGQRGRPSSVSAQKSKKGKNKKPSADVDKQTENDAKSEMEMEQPVKRKKPKLSYPCINRKYSWKRNVLSKEAKRLKKEARMKKLRETREKKLRGEYVPQKTRKRQPKTTATIRQSQRVAVKRRLQQLTASSSNILPSSTGDGTSQRTSVPPQQVSLPFVAVTDINIQTVPPTENPGAPPFIFAIVPSATGDGQVLQAVPNSVLQDAVNSSNQVIPDQDQAKPD
uniref:snRNA-activating protein complex subunit 4 n=2 Tax=Magallana gigas TaxID=29159 RepID=A0A8W8LAZ1_MAGGI